MSFTEFYTKLNDNLTSFGKAGLFVQISSDTRQHLKTLKYIKKTQAGRHQETGKEAEIDEV